jgi:hypothetical protein
LELERRVSAAMRAPVRSDARARETIMSKVRVAAAEGMPVRALPAGRRPARHSIVGLALAAGVGSITTISALVPSSREVAASGSAAMATAVIGDSVVATLRDTLRLVRLIFDDPMARQVAVVGDFNGWRSEETPMRRADATRRWSVTLALREGEHRYAFVVDGTRWVPDRATAAGRGDDGRVYSLLHVTRRSN